MPLKCKSDQVRTEYYDYNLDAGENILMPIKARPGEVIIVHSISLYNPTQANFTHAYKMLRTKGRLRRLTYAAALNTITVLNWNIDVYLIEHEECGFAITPNAASDLIEATFQIIRCRDDEYFKAT